MDIHTAQHCPVDFCALVDFSRLVLCNMAVISHVTMERLA